MDAVFRHTRCPEVPYSIPRPSSANTQIPEDIHDLTREYKLIDLGIVAHTRQRPLDHLV
jgi:hypothetical protein